MDVAKILVGRTYGIAREKDRIPAGAAGLTVSVVFTDPVWDDMSKTVVFRGAGNRIAEFDGKTAVIPWEVMTEPGTRVFFGVYGTNEETGMKLPLIEVDIGYTEKATDTQADPGTDPTLPIWAQLQKEIEQLKQSGVSEETITKIVNDYLEKNPPSVTETDPTVSEWAKSAEKPQYTADEVGALSTEALAGAVNDALAQAKASGEFDGAPGKDGADGQPGKDGYTPVKGVDYFDGNDYVLTADDKTEIAEQAAALVEVPEGGGIAVTGATVGQTVKISAVDAKGVPTAWEPVDFPSGGGGEVWDILLDAMTDEDISTFEVTEAPDGHTLDDYTELYVAYYVAPNSAGISSGINFAFCDNEDGNVFTGVSVVTTPVIAINNTNSAGKSCIIQLKKNILGWFATSVQACTTDSNPGIPMFSSGGGTRLNIPYNTKPTDKISKLHYNPTTIKKIVFGYSTKVWGAGSSVAIFGKRSA